MSVSTTLGTQHEVNLPQGTIRYREHGSGDPVVFVHGFLANGDLWSRVVPELGGRFRCITPDWPLGSHEVPMTEDADLGGPALARLIADFLEALDLHEVTLVGNDTGGALCQMVVTRHPARVGRLVLTNCDAFDNFPPQFFKVLLAPVGLPGGAWALFQPFRVRALRNTPIGYGWLTKRGLDRETSDSFVCPGLARKEIRRDARKVLTGLHPRQTLEAATRLSTFDGPVLIAWAKERQFFPWEHAELLAGAFPSSRLEAIEDSYTFVPLDQPQRLAELIADFVAPPAGAEMAAAAV